MLGLFSARPDHPFADTREAQRALTDLPAQDPRAALDNATAWLESLVATPEFRADRRLELVFQLDEAVLPQTRRLGREYLTTQGMSRAQEYKLWQLNRAYWAQLAAAYEDSLERHRDREKGAEVLKPHLAMLCARSLHAYGSLLKWDQFRYGPIEDQLWTAVGNAYQVSLRERLGGKILHLYGAGGAQTTPEAEYLKLLLFHASSMDSLLPVEIEIAERVIAHLVPLFSLDAEHSRDHVYWVDTARPLPPTRLAKVPEITPTLRFFSTASALGELASLRDGVQASGALPASVNFGGQYSPRVVLPVLDHLAARWAPKPPMRSHARHRVKSRLTVVSGLSTICGRLAGLESAEADGAEAWVVADVSQGGMGAHVPLAGKDWLRVGSLVGLQPEGGKNWLVGIVRRLVRESEHWGSVGLETLSKDPRRIVGDCGGLPTEGILLDPLTADTEVRLALPVPVWEEQIPLVLDLDGLVVRLVPQARADTGFGHVVGRYLVKPA